MTFALNIIVNARSLDVMKGYLTRAIPNVKSSHRCEALARALGYRTYAGLLHIATHQPGDVATADAGAFLSYMAKHDFQIPSEPLFRAVASGALALVHDQEPRLTVWGMGVGELQHKDAGGWESYQERAQRAAQARRELLSDGSITPFLLSLALVSRIPRTATIRTGTGSYKLKHIAENYATASPDGGALGPHYVPNGLLIAAAIHAGFRHKVYWRDSGFEEVNVSFNMSKRAIDDLDCEIRPDGARAQDRQRKDEMRQFRKRFPYSPF